METRARIHYPFGIGRHEIDDLPDVECGVERRAADRERFLVDGRHQSRTDFQPDGCH